MLKGSYLNYTLFEYRFPKVSGFVGGAKEISSCFWLLYSSTPLSVSVPRDWVSQGIVVCFQRVQPQGSRKAEVRLYEHSQRTSC